MHTLRDTHHTRAVIAHCMKFTILIFSFFTSLIFLSCNKPKTCNCIVDEKLLSQNDSTIIKSKTWNIWSVFGDTLLQTSKLNSFRLGIFPTIGDEVKTRYLLQKDSNEVFLTITTLATEKIIALTNEDWNDFNKVISDSCFWSIPTNPTLENKLILDGTTLVFEAYSKQLSTCTKRNYHLIARKKGYGPKTYFNICNKLIALSKK